MRKGKGFFWRGLNMLRDNLAELLGVDLKTAPRPFSFSEEPFGDEAQLLQRLLQETKLHAFYECYPCKTTLKYTADGLQVSYTSNSNLSKDMSDALDSILTHQSPSLDLKCKICGKLMTLRYSVFGNEETNQGRGIRPHFILANILQGSGGFRVRKILRSLPSQISHNGWTYECAGVTVGRRPEDDPWLESPNGIAHYVSYFMHLGEIFCYDGMMKDLVEKVDETDLETRVTYEARHALYLPKEYSYWWRIPSPFVAPI